VVPVKHPHTLSGEPDPGALGYTSAALETASDCHAALKQQRRRRRVVYKAAKLNENRH